MRGRMVILWLLTLVMVGWVMVSSPVQAAAISQSCALEVVGDLTQRGVLDETMAQTQRDYYRSHSDLYPLSLGEQVRGVLTFANIIWVVASFLIVLAVVWLGGIYLVALLALIPIEGYEILAYGVCGGLIVASPSEFWALPGAIAINGVWAWSHGLHPKTLEGFYRTLKTNPITFGSGVLTLLWGGMAIAYQSSVFGFLAILALEAFFGFVVTVTPGIYSFGFRSRRVIPYATFASLALILVYTAHLQGWITIPQFSIFQRGVFYIGTFVYSLGMLIWSSKWYHHERPWMYPVLQIGAIASGVAALYFGTMLNIGTFQGIGGTFFFLYALEKYFELPWRKEFWAWGTLGLALLLWGSAWVMQNYPEFFLWG